MTKKQTLIKAIMEMNIDMISLLLEDNRSYMQVPKEVFVNELSRIFTNLKEVYNQYSFSKVLDAKCLQEQYYGNPGFTFLTDDNHLITLMFFLENNIIMDIQVCLIFENTEFIEDRQKIVLSFYNDEKVSYRPSSKLLTLQSNIEIVLKEFNQFKNNVTSITEFCQWQKEVEKLYDSVETMDRMNYKFLNPLSSLHFNNSYIQDLITLHPYAKQAIKDYNEINIQDEPELIEWLFKYEDNELDYGDYVRVDNWQHNNLILHAQDNSVVIDCTGYSESILFSKIYPDHYSVLFEKYQITDEEFQIAKKELGIESFDLRTFLKVRNLYGY
ncbi:hypothetical protein [Bizionia arctica]|uniref:Uncharacterized protein n=1 Tax=Bizionia arctica TaxID=1495645 RepID=A0A917LQA4_9FLAO|nr:hypothetical protein [Bizionia arctica]GGG51619.1 hypothetical protein GCM10010976_23480 [Bizionia arctica]